MDDEFDTYQYVEPIRQGFGPQVRIMARRFGANIAIQTAKERDVREWEHPGWFIEYVYMSTSETQKLINALQDMVHKADKELESRSCRYG